MVIDGLNPQRNREGKGSGRTTKGVVLQDSQDEGTGTGGEDDTEYGGRKRTL